MTGRSSSVYVVFAACKAMCGHFAHLLLNPHHRPMGQVLSPHFTDEENETPSH